MSSSLPSRLVIVAGTYDGVLAGWDTVDHGSPDDDDDDDKSSSSPLLHLSFAMPAHEGSVRCLSLCSNMVDKRRQPGLLLSGGFDEALRVFDLNKHREAGETKSPQELGTPTASCFAPALNPTHCLVGLTSGKILLYKKRDWSVAHVLGGGHTSDGTTTGDGVSCLAVHPTGKMALSGGVRDGRLCLWDLVKGRLAFVHKVVSGGGGSSGARKPRVHSVVWSHDGTKYAFSHGNKVTARDATSGEDLLDVSLPSRTNQLCFLRGGEEDGLYYVACACDDGSLPVLAVGSIDNSVRAVMAVEPVEGVVAGEDRIKCIQSFEDGFLVATANSGGVVSVMDLSGAVQMILDEDNSDDDDEDDDLVAVEILDSVRVGSDGARITNIACWSSGDAGRNDDDEEEIDVADDSDKKQDEEKLVVAPSTSPPTHEKRKRKDYVEMDAEAIKKARKLVSQAKKRQKQKEKKKNKKKNKE